MALRKFSVHGNAFDQKYARYALNDFKKYEEFWARYIGCDSFDEKMSRELNIVGLSEDDDKLRKVIWQWNYTIFLNYIHLDELCEIKLDFTLDNFTQLERIYLLATHLYYTSMECIGKIEIKLNIISKNDEIGFKGFGVFRNIMAHNVRPLVKQIENDYFVIDPNEMGKFENTDHNKRNISEIWTDGFNLRKDLIFIPLYQFIDKLKASMIHEFNKILKREFEKFEKIPQLGEAPEYGGNNDRYGKPIVSGMDFYGNKNLPRAR